MAGSSSSRVAFVGNSASSARFMFRPSFIRREFRMLSRALSVASDVFVEVSPNVSRGRVRSSETLLSPLAKSGLRVRLRRESCISNRNHRLTWSSLVVALPDAARRSRRRAPALRCASRVRRASFPARASIQERGDWGLSGLATRPISTIWSRRFCTSAAALPMRRLSTRSCGVFPRLSSRLKRWAFL